MPRAGTLLRSLGLGAATVVVAASPLLADWLVMKGGGRYETKGGWEVRGNQVVFYRPNGALSSLKLDDVDVDASKAATEAAANPQPTPAPTAAPAKKAAVVLTDADVKHVEAAPAEAAAAAVPTAPPDRVRVQEFHQDLTDVSHGVTILGEVVNTSQDLVGEIHVTARLFDEKGKEMASNEAMLGTGTLKPGITTNFRVSFPGVYTYSEVRFECKSLGVRTSNATAHS